METRAYFESIRSGELERLRRLLAEQPDLLNARTTPDEAPKQPLGCTGLHAAVHASRSHAARTLIDAGIDIEARTREGRTALHDSIEFGERELTELLLESGKD